MKIEWMEICRVLGCDRKRQCDAPVCPRCWHLTPAELRDECLRVFSVHRGDREAQYAAVQAVLTWHRTRRVARRRAA